MVGIRFGKAPRAPGVRQNARVSIAHLARQIKRCENDAKKFHAGEKINPKPAAPPAP